MTKVDIQSNQAERSAKPLTLEREKEMEFNTIMQALVKDLAEQLRPMVADMVREELAKTPSNEDLGRAVLKAVENIAENLDLADLAQRFSDFQLATIAGHLSMADLAGELSDSQLNSIAGDIDLSDLADEIDVDKIAAKVDYDEAIRDFFSNNTFSLSP